MSRNSDFIQGPEAFGRTYNLYPFNQMVVNEDHNKNLAHDTTQITQVQGDNKVAFCDIRPANTFESLPADRGGDYNYFENLMVMHITSNRPHPDAFPVYYLPWKENRLCRIKLKPSPHHPKKTPGWFWGRLGVETIDPNIFVTAALQGCSVFVHGDPESPVVYHANAAGSNLPGPGLASRVDEEFRATAHHKATVMTQRTVIAQERFPKEGPKVRGVRQPAPRSISGRAHLMDYMPGELPSGDLLLRQRYAEKYRVSPEDVQVQQNGTVFGFRQDRNWEFWLQTRTYVSYFKPETRSTEMFVEPECRKFWPIVG